MSQEYYNIKVPILCNSKEEAQELQSQVEKMFVLKAGFIGMLARAYQAEPQKIKGIIDAVSSNPMNAVGKIGDIVAMVKKYS